MTAQACARAWALCAALGLLAGCAGTPSAGGDASGPLYKRSSGVTVYGEIDVGVGRRR